MGWSRQPESRSGGGVAETGVLPGAAPVARPVPAAHAQPVPGAGPGRAPADPLVVAAGRQAGRRDALLVGAFGFLLTAAFAWVPSIWYDEVATVTATTRTWPELWRMLGTVDAVHGLYYLLMHAWIDLVGYSPFALRLPSAIVTGVAAGCLVALARRVTTRTIALVAGVSFCLFPRVTWMGSEGRSYALSVALAVCLTLVLASACRRAGEDRRTRVLWWSAYGALAIVSVTVFIYLAMLVVAHGVTLLWAAGAARGGSARGGSTDAGGTDAGGTDAGSSGGGSVLGGSDGSASAIPGGAGRRADALRSLRGWAAASAVAGIVCLPLAVAIMEQAGQVSWIDPIGAHSFRSVFLTQLFLANPWFATAAWSLAALGGIVFALGRRAPDPVAPLAVPPSPFAPTLAQLAVPWAVVPPLGLVLMSVLLDPLYSPRYLTFTAPAVALVVAVGAVALGRDRRTVVVVLLLAALSAPTFVAQRQTEAKQNSSWSEVASIVAAERAETAKEEPGTREAVIYGPLRKHPSATSRVISYAYPYAFEGLEDFALKTPAGETGRLWEKRYRVRDRLDKLNGVDVVWLVTSDRQDWRPGITARLAPLGFTLDEEWNLSYVNLLRFERTRDGS
jgi:mannosyltransferase